MALWFLAAGLWQVPASAVQRPENPKPPHESYDAKKGETTYSSGDIRTGGLTGMSAEFKFPGKVPVKPSFILLGVGSLRLKHETNAADETVLKYSHVNDARFQIGGSVMDIPAKQSWKVSENSMVKLIYGHAIEESADIQLTLDQFHSLASSEGFTVSLGSLDGTTFSQIDERTIKVSQLKGFRGLDAFVSSMQSGDSSQSVI